MPHELLPTIPPMVHQACVAGSGPNVKSNARAAGIEIVEHYAGLNPRRPLLRASISMIRFMCRLMSTTTATLHAWPAKLVPAPRPRMARCGADIP